MKFVIFFSEHSLCWWFYYGSLGRVHDWASCSFTGNPLRVLLGLMGSAFGRLVGNGLLRESLGSIKGLVGGRGSIGVVSL